MAATLWAYACDIAGIIFSVLFPFPFPEVFGALGEAPLLLLFFSSSYRPATADDRPFVTDKFKDAGCLPLACMLLLRDGAAGEDIEFDDGAALVRAEVREATRATVSADLCGNVEFKFGAPVAPVEEGYLVVDLMMFAPPVESLSVREGLLLYGAVEDELLDMSTLVPGGNAWGADAMPWFVDAR